MCLRQAQRTSTPSTFLFPKNECLFCAKNRIKVKKDRTTKEELPDKLFVSWIHIPSGYEITTALAEDMQHIGYGMVWRKVSCVDLPAAEAHFHESWQCKSQ